MASAAASLEAALTALSLAEPDDEKFLGALKTGCRITMNLAEHPDDPKFRFLRYSNKALSSRLLEVGSGAGTGVLLALGFVEGTHGGERVLRYPHNRQGRHARLFSELFDETKHSNETCRGLDVFLRALEAVGPIGDKRFGRRGEDRPRASGPAASRKWPPDFPCSCLVEDGLGLSRSELRESSGFNRVRTLMPSFPAYFAGLASGIACLDCATLLAADRERSLLLPGRAYHVTISLVESVGEDQSEALDGGQYVMIGLTCWQDGANSGGLVAKHDAVRYIPAATSAIESRVAELKTEIDCDGPLRRAAPGALATAREELVSFQAAARRAGSTLMSCLFGCGLLPLLDEPGLLPPACARTADPAHLLHSLITRVGASSGGAASADKDHLNNYLSNRLALRICCQYLDSASVGAVAQTCKRFGTDLLTTRLCKQSANAALRAAPGFRQLSASRVYEAKIDAGYALQLRDSLCELRAGGPLGPSPLIVHSVWAPDDADRQKYKYGRKLMCLTMFGDRVFSGDDSGFVQLWSTEAQHTVVWEPEWEFQLTADVVFCVFACQRRGLLAAGGGGGCRPGHLAIFDGRTLKSPCAVLDKGVGDTKAEGGAAPDLEDVLSLAACRADGVEYLASAHMDGSILIWPCPSPNFAVGKWRAELALAPAHDDCVQQLVSHREWLVSAAEDKKVKVWRVGGDWACERVLDHPTGLFSCLMHKSKILTVEDSEDHTLRVWSMSGVCLATLPKQGGPLISCGADTVLVARGKGIDCWDTREKRWTKKAVPRPNKVAISQSNQNQNLCLCADRVFSLRKSGMELVVLSSNQRCP